MLRRPVARRMARTAVVAGTATAVAGRHAGANPPPQPEPAPAQAAAASPEPGADPVDQLTKLAALKDQGVLTDEEFANQKAKILAQM
jgi:hypothetical protein